MDEILQNLAGLSVKWPHEERLRPVFLAMKHEDKHLQHTRPTDYLTFRVQAGQG